MKKELNVEWTCRKKLHKKKVYKMRMMERKDYIKRKL